MYNVKGKVAVVTGASSGIGRAIALRLARRGVRIALVARSSRPLDEVAAAIRTQRGEALVVVADVADPAAVEAAHARIVRELGPPAILVNAAGFGIWKAFAEVTTAEHEGMMGTIYWGSFSWIRVVLPSMRARGSGYIVNVAAASARIPLSVTSGYSAATAALTALSESLHRELWGTGVRVACLNPGSVQTGFWDPERIPPQGLPPLVRWAPRISPGAVAREAEACIRLGVGFRTFPVFVGLLARVNALWYRAGDALLSRWFLPVAGGLVVLRIVTRLF